MKALYFDQDLRFIDVPDPVPIQGEVLIRVLTSAICNTDQEIVKGYMGFRGIPGHEFTGIVLTEASPLYNKLVVGEINCSCGTCYLCLTGRPSHCPNRTVTGIFDHSGAFAEYIALPGKNLHVIPEGLDLLKAVFTEPLAAAVEIADQIHIRPSQSVFIFGAGKLGMLISLVFKHYGCDAVTIDIHPLKLAKAKELGIKALHLDDLGSSDKAEVCIDCTGSSTGIHHAMNHLYPRGTLVLKTTVAETAKIDLNQVVINEFRIEGSRCGPFPPALQLLASGLIDPMPLITRVFPFESLPDAFHLASSPESWKIVIDHRITSV